MVNAKNFNSLNGNTIKRVLLEDFSSRSWPIRAFATMEI